MSTILLETCRGIWKNIIKKGALCWNIKSNLLSMCAVPRCDCFFVVPWIRAFPVCCTGIVCVILRWFHLPPLLLVSFLLLLCACAVLLLLRLYTSFVNTHVPFSLLRIMTSGLLLGMVLSVFSSWFYNVYLPSWLVCTNFGICPYLCSLSNFIFISGHMLRYNWAHTL